jgi:hypothetical protein
VRAGPECQAELLAHHGGKEATDRVLLPARGSHDGGDRRALTLFEQREARDRGRFGKVLHEHTRKVSSQNPSGSLLKTTACRLLRGNSPRIKLCGEVRASQPATIDWRAITWPLSICSQRWYGGFNESRP